MKSEKKTSSGKGSKLSRSKTVTVRLDPKTRYLAELAARRRHRTLSSFIEWAIERGFGEVVVTEVSDDNQHEGTLASEAEALWDVDVADRLAKLALRHPELLNFDEQILWKLVRENDYFWHRNTVGVVRKLREDNLNFVRLRETWELLEAVAKGEADASVLPTSGEAGNAS